MSLPVIRTPRAEEDLIAIWLNIASDNPPAADRQLDAFEEKFLALTTTPLMGAAREDIADGLRYFPVGRHLILYRVHQSALEIVRVVDGARRLEKLDL